MTGPVLIHGVFVRQHHGKVQVLVETEPHKWKQVFCEAMAPDTPTSHIIEPAGIRRCPVVDSDGDWNPVA